MYKFLTNFLYCFRWKLRDDQQKRNGVFRGTRWGRSGPVTPVRDGRLRTDGDTAMFNPPKLHNHENHGFLTMIATFIETTVTGRGQTGGGWRIGHGHGDANDTDGGGGDGPSNITVKDAISMMFENQLNADKVLVLYLEMAIVVAYGVLFVIGLVSNGLVCFVVFRQCGKKNVPSQGPSPRNLYIVNLAFADIIMCVVCMPFTLWALMSRRWTWGLIMCKTVPAAQGANITVSACTITAIALDRLVVCNFKLRNN